MDKKQLLDKIEYFTKEIIVQDGIILLNPEIVKFYLAEPEDDFSIEKAVIQTPVSDKDGSVLYDQVPSGASVWVTVTKEGSPLKGRPILITKRPDGLFALTGGSGFKQVAESAGIDEVNARKHLAIAFDKGPQKNKREKEIDEQIKQAEIENAPLVLARKELAQEARKEIGVAKEAFLLAVGIETQADKAILKKQVDDIAEKVFKAGLSRDEADNFARIIARQQMQNEKRIREIKSEERIFKLAARLREIRENPDKTNEIIGELNSQERSLSSIVPITNIESFKGLTPEEIENKIGNIIQEKTNEIIVGESSITELNKELQAEGISGIKKDESQIEVSLGTSVKPLEIKNTEQLQIAVKTHLQYQDIKKKHEEISKKIKVVDQERVTPAILDSLRLEARSVTAQELSDEEIEKRLPDYANVSRRNLSTLDFYSALSDQWNDEKSLRDKISKIDSSFGNYVTSGANAALAALSSRYIGKRVDSSYLVENSSIEVAANILALKLRKQYENNSKEFDSVIQKLKEENLKVIPETEQKALEESKNLKQKFSSLQKEKEKGNLTSESVITGFEIDNLTRQKENLGTALGSMEAMAAFYDAIVKARSARNADLKINFGNDIDGMKYRFNKLFPRDTKVVRGLIDASDTNNVSIVTNSLALDKWAKEFEDNIELRDTYNSIKTDTSNSIVKNDGEVYASNYKISAFKDKFKDNTGEEREYSFRLAQRNDIEWLDKAKGGVVSRVTGAGKTNTAFGFFAKQLERNKDYSAFSIVPKGRVKQWVDEARKFTNISVVEIPEGTNVEERNKVLESVKPGQMVVISHRDAAISSPIINALYMSGISKGMFIDEPQELQSRSLMGNYSAAARKIMKLPSEHRIALTATPARTKPTEIWDLVNWTTHRANLLGPRTRFERVYNGLGAGTNSQEQALNKMLFNEISPFISGDKLTDPNFKVEHKDIRVNRTDTQTYRMKQVNDNAEKYIVKRKRDEIERIQSSAEDLKRYQNKYGSSWKAQVSTRVGKTAREEILSQFNDVFHGIPSPENLKANSKINSFVDEINNDFKEGLKKHVIFVDSATQRRAVYDTLLNLGYKSGQVRNISPATTDSLSGKQMSERVKAFQDLKDVNFAIIDKQSSSGYNLQAGNVLHVLGTPYDCAQYLQAQGRVARSPRVGNVTIKTYRYSDNPFEDAKWSVLDRQMKILRATAPGLFVGNK